KETTRGFADGLAVVVSHPSSKKRSMDGAQFHLPWVGEAGGRLTLDSVANAFFSQDPIRSVSSSPSVPIPYCLLPGPCPSRSLVPFFPCSLPLRRLHHHIRRRARRQRYRLARQSCQHGWIPVLERRVSYQRVHVIIA